MTWLFFKIAPKVTKFWATFSRKVVAKNVKKSPNLVTLRFLFRCMSRGGAIVIMVEEKLEQPFSIFHKSFWQTEKGSIPSCLLMSEATIISSDGGGGGCGSVGRVVNCNTSDPKFKSHHQPNIFTINCIESVSKRKK